MRQIRQFEPSSTWSNQDGTPTARALGWMRSISDFVGAGTGATPSEVAAASIAEHEAAANPHPTYLTQAEGDALYSALGHTHTTEDVLLENRTDDPSSPATGRIWLRTDL